MLRILLAPGRRIAMHKGHSVTTGSSEVSAEKLSTNDVHELEEPEMLEPWADWVRRVTHQIENQMKRLQIKSWVCQARARKWKYAGRVASHASDRWTHRLFHCDPEVFFDGPSTSAPGANKRGQKQDGLISWKGSASKNTPTDGTQQLQAWQTGSC